MNRLLGIALGLLAALWLPLSASAQLTPVPLGTSAASYGYYEYLPFGYDDATTEEWPVVIFLHGIGERGNGTTELSKVLATGLPQNISSGTRYPFIGILPQSPSTAGSWSVGNLDALVQFVKSNYHVNEDRIYLTGLSMGGIGTWNYAAANPEELAAIWPQCGAPSGTPNGAALVNVPTWAFTTWGDTQSGANPDYTVRWVNSIATALGATSPLLANYPGTYTGPPGPGNTSDKDRTVSFTDSTNAWTWLDDVAQVAGSHPTLTLYKDTSHNCWTRTYNNPIPMKWLLAQNRFGAANKAPTVNITAPASTTFNDPSSITITAQVTDSDGTISRVEFYAGSQLLGTDNVSPHQLVWSNPPAGTHWITVKAIDNDNAVGAALVKVIVTDGGGALCSQDFQSSTSVASYVHATAPSSNPCQLNDISAEVDGGTWSIQGGRLQLVREGSSTVDNDAGITRHTDFPGPPSLLHVTFDLGVSAWTASQSQTGALWIIIGKVSGFSDYGNGDPAVNMFQTMSVNGKGAGRYAFAAAGLESAQFNTDGALHRVALFLNKSGAAASYRAPDNTLRSLQSNGVALWVDSAPVVVDAAAVNGSSSTLTDLRFRWASSENATWQLDNWVIRHSFPQ